MANKKSKNQQWRRSSKKKGGGGRRNKKNAAAPSNPPPPMPPPPAHRVCQHGLEEILGPNNDDPVVPRIEEFYTLLCKEHTFAHEMFVENTFESDPEMMDHPAMVPYGLYLATQTILTGNDDHWKAAKFVLHTVTHIQKGSTRQRLQTMDDEGDTETAYKVMANKMIKRMQKYKSKKDVILALDRKIPCDCLAHLKAKVMEEPEMRQCMNCHKESPNNRFCEQCLFAEYCCRACQRAHWKNHEEECKLFVKADAIPWWSEDEDDNQQQHQGEDVE